MPGSLEVSFPGVAKYPSVQFSHLEKKGVGDAVGAHDGHVARPLLRGDDLDRGAEMGDAHRRRAVAVRPRNLGTRSVQTMAVR